MKNLNVEQIARIKKSYAKEASNLTDALIGMRKNRKKLGLKNPSDLIDGVIEGFSEKLRLIGSPEAGFLILPSDHADILGSVGFVCLTDSPNSFQIKSLHIVEKHRRKGYAIETVRFISKALKSVTGNTMGLLSDCRGESDEFMSVLKKLGAVSLNTLNCFGENMVAWSDDPKYRYDLMRSIEPIDLNSLENQSSDDVAKGNAIISALFEDIT